MRRRIFHHALHGARQKRPPATKGNDDSPAFFRADATRRVLRVTFLLIAFAVAAPATASAHVRWFVDETKCPLCHFVWDLTSGMVIAGGALFAAAAAAVHNPAWIRALGKRCAGLYRALPGIEWRLIAFLGGAMLVINSITHIYLAPHVELPGMLMPFGFSAQFILGLILLSQITFSVAGLMLLVVAGFSALLIPMHMMIDYLFEFIGLGAALFFAGPALSSFDRRFFRSLGLDASRYADLPVPVIRVAFGVTFIVLALDEKLLHPHLAAAFLQLHHFNFMPALGFQSFTDMHFVLAAGVAELTFGLLLVAGIATRFVTAMLSLFFVFTMLALGPTEMIGHFPLFGIVFLLLCRGAGRFGFQRGAISSIAACGSAV